MASLLEARDAKPRRCYAAARRWFRSCSAARRPIASETSPPNLRRRPEPCMTQSTNVLVSPLLLVGDIGGTRTRLALYTRSGERPLREEIVPSREHPTFEAVAERFLAGARPDIAVLG